jgi:putative membrane protein
MADDHDDLNKQIATVADQMGLRVPKVTNSAGKAEYDKLNALSGADFDTEYLKYTSKANHEAFRDFRTESTTTTDANVRALIAKAAPIIREHSMAIDKIGHDHGIEMPGRRPGPHPAGANPPAAPPPQ